MVQPDVVKLEIPRSAQFVTVARKTIECIGSRLKLTDAQVGDVTLAVGEACANAVKFGDPNSNSVYVQYSIAHDRLEIEVRNAGPAFRWKKHRPVPIPIKDLPEGGLGLFLIEQLMDEIIVRSESGVTAVTMVKMI
jgi:serine/threonine-protein kinase RsbW